MGQYRRLTLSAKANKTQRDSFQEKTSVDNDYLRNCELRLCFLEDAIENGELVFLKDEKVEEKRWIKSVKTLTAENKRLKAQINDLKSTKDGYKKRFFDSGYRNKKLSLKVRALKKEIERLERVIKDKDSLCYDCKKSVEDFAESLEARCFNEEFYTPLHDAIEKELKEYMK